MSYLMSALSLLSLAVSPYIIDYANNYRANLGVAGHGSEILFVIVPIIILSIQIGGRKRERN